MLYRIRRFLRRRSGADIGPRLVVGLDDRGRVRWADLVALDPALTLPTVRLERIASSRAVRFSQTLLIAASLTVLPAKGERIAAISAVS